MAQQSESRLSKNIYQKRYRWCFVPQCGNNSKTNGDKIFIHVPQDPTRRKAWLKAVRRKEDTPQSVLFCCEDHFEVSILMHFHYESKTKLKFCMLINSISLAKKKFLQFVL